MRLAVCVLALLAVAARDTGCGAPERDPCAGAPCGTSCRACDPDDGDCVETTVVKACDRAGSCVAATADLCGAPIPVPGTCDGKGCRDACELAPRCALAGPACALPVLPGQCSDTGTCEQFVLCSAPEHPVEGYPVYDGSGSDGFSGGGVVIEVERGGRVVRPEYIDPAP